MHAKRQTGRAISRTLNAQYEVQRYGLGNANTTYPISAFVTHLVHLRGGSVLVDVAQITVRGSFPSPFIVPSQVGCKTDASFACIAYGTGIHSVQALGVRCVEIESSAEREGVPQFDARCVREVIDEILSRDNEDL